uniref:Ribosomal protein S7 n=1 Tax=Taxus wallichiana var. mairei TaxID=120273 RepID=L7NPF9_TAXWM|nr:ribosomal protein S7 [Taxus mairei]
MFICFLSYFF